MDDSEQELLSRQLPRLVQLMDPDPPRQWNSRDDIMLQLAHALVWKCDASIHGGFVRDTIIRGESARDLDVQVSPPRSTLKSVERKLIQFLAKSPGALAKGLRITGRRTKGAALALSIQGSGLRTAIDVDLVDRATLDGVVAHPGVDSDVGNLLFNRNDFLRKKVDHGDDTIVDAVSNALEAQFVFYYPLESGRHQSISVWRLKKYLGRGWTCLSPVPYAVQKQFLSPKERALIASD